MEVLKLCVILEQIFKHYQTHEVSDFCVSTTYKNYVT